MDGNKIDQASIRIVCRFTKCSEVLVLHVSAGSILGFLSVGLFVVVPILGGLLCGLVITFFASEAKGHVVPEVMQAIALRGGRIRPRVVVAKVVASALCLGSGGSTGREGFHW